jgi:hypothetical protein
MYANYPPAVWAGNLYYGFSKEVADVAWHGPIFVVTRPAGPLILHAQVGDGAPLPPSEFEAVRGLFDLPVLGKRADGSLVCSHFGWDVRDASVHRARACVTLEDPETFGPTPRRYHGVPDSTFVVAGMRWRLSWPTICPM